MVDRLELMTSLIGPEDTLKLVKTIRHSTDAQGGVGNVYYPFYGHIDFGMTGGHP